MKIPRTLQLGPHIHFADDGRGNRVVWLNGQVITNCFYADTRKGKVIRFAKPIQIVKHGQGTHAKRETLYGRVEVVFR
jgi:hypothetical protein